MAHCGLEALFLTRERDIRYYSGFLTRFWESPTRPWFLIIPSSGMPVAVIPSIGSALMSKTWIEDIRTWSSPDLADDGVGLLADTLTELTPKNAKIGLPHGHETHLRMPLGDYEHLGKSIGERQLVHDQNVVRDQQLVKSALEVSKIRHACSIAGAAFEQVPEIAANNQRIDEIFRRFQMSCLDCGADWIPYLAGGAEKGGYSDVISPATDAALKLGDVLMLDTGLVWDGYFCDFDRNWSIGPATEATKDAFSMLIEATNAAFDIARPGRTAAELFHAMNAIVSPDDSRSDAGRFGHGVGMSLTEWPSIIPSDRTVLAPGMVLAIEPVIAVGDKILVHEENILITEGAPEYLTVRAPAELPVL
jgi:Xaa-Pro aminopeptidase